MSIYIRSKIEKKSRENHGKFEKTGLTIVVYAPKGAEPSVRKEQRSLLAFHSRYKCSMETTRNS